MTRVTKVFGVEQTDHSRHASGEPSIISDYRDGSTRNRLVLS